MKKEVLRKAPQINSGTPTAQERVYINPDLTSKEREQEKVLRKEKKERESKGEKDLVIRNGKIVVRKKVQSDATGDANAREH